MSETLDLYTLQRRMLGQCGEQLATAIELLDRAYAQLRLYSNGLDLNGYGDLMVDIDDFREVVRGE